MKITKLRYQLYIFHITILTLFFILLWVTYTSYQTQYKKDILTYVNNEVHIYEKNILSSINSATSKLKKQKSYFTSIHTNTLKILKQNPDFDLDKLKNEIKSKYLLPYMDVELFLIDKSYTIYKTTYPKDLGFDLSVITEAKAYLDKTFKDGKVYVSDFISTDALDMQYKLYSYSKLNDETYLELGFVDTTLTNTVESLLKENTNALTTISLYNVSKDNKQYYYYPMEKREYLKFKEGYYRSIKKFPIDEPTDDIIINVMKSGSPKYLNENGTYTVYTKVFKKNMFSVLGFEDIIMKLDIDVSDKLTFLNSNKKFFIMMFSLYFIASVILILAIKNRFTNPIEEILTSIKNLKKVENETILSMNNELSELSLQYNAVYDQLTREIKLNKKLTLLDPLTQAYNKKAFDQGLEELLSLYDRYKTPFSLILFDIDNFKRINDNYGHLVGNEVLISIVKLINKTLRKTDTLYRIGGEEFIIICKNTIKSDTISVAEKIRKTVEESLKIIQNEIITISIGVTEVVDNDNETTIYQRVDENLYISKNGGKNKITAK